MTMTIDKKYLLLLLIAVPTETAFAQTRSSLVASENVHSVSRPVRSERCRSPDISEIVLHATGGFGCAVKDGEAIWKHFKAGSFNSTIADLENRHRDVSIHYVIGRNGELVSMVPEDQIASHAASANCRSIGIELINHGDQSDEFPAAQKDTLYALLADILQRHSLDVSAITTHSAVDTRCVTCELLSPTTVKENFVGCEVPDSHRRRIDPGDKLPVAVVREEVKARLTGRQ